MSIASEQKKTESPRVMLCAPGSGNGKTLLTCAILRLLKKQNMEPAAFKCGPDFIDPLFHTKVLGVPSRNLDLFLAKRDGVLHALQKGLEDVQGERAGVGIIEGVMGFYDGLGVDTFAGSSYDLCVQTGTPAILIVNARGMGRSTLALIRGFLDYADSPVIRGVFLNQVSPSFAKELCAQIERELHIPVVGFLPKLPGDVFGSRHLGLILPDEIPDILEKIDAAADALAEHLNMDLFLQIANGAAPLTMPQPDCNAGENDHKPRVRVGVAYDEAFCFYYADNLDCLAKAGAEVVFFSPLHDAKLPDVSRVIFGGGYPELHAKELSENTGMLESIRAAVRDGMPMLAECGGFLYLKESLSDPDGNTYPMAGILPGKASMGTKLSHFGYVTLSAEKDNPYLQRGEQIRGHEFHYYRETDAASDQGGAGAIQTIQTDVCRIEKPSGRTWSGYACNRNVFGGFAHLYYPSCPALVERFLRL